MNTHMLKSVRLLIAAGLVALCLVPDSAQRSSG
jgi:hypothetical protein